MHQDYFHPSSLSKIYKSLFDFNPDASFALDLQGRFVLFNNIATDLTGYSEEEILQLSYSDLVKEEYVDSMNEFFREVLSGTKKNYEVSINHKLGCTVDLFGTSVPITVDGQVIGLAGIVKDITEKNRLQKELEVSNDNLRNILDSLTVCLWSCNPEHTETYQVTSACRKIYGYPEEAFYSNPTLWLEVIHPDDFPYVKEMQEKLSDGKILNLEYRIMNPDGKVKWVSNETRPVFNETGEMVRLDGLIIEIDERKKIEEKLEYMANHDMLTNLPNRRLFKKILRTSISNTKSSESGIAILFIDLDDFKFINDTLGHNRGDRLLKIIAKRLQHVLRKGDIISRLSGDEFTVLLQHITEIKQVERVAQKVIHAITKPIRLGDKKYVITASVGISLFPEHSDNVENLIRQADQAMYLAKNNGKNNYKFYQSGMSDSLSRRLAIEQGLRQAIKKDDLFLNYQPFVDSKTGTAVGFEALLRFKDKKLGIISPAEFIPIAEESGLIVPIGEWVLHMACRQFKELNDRGLPPVFVSVNVSFKQLEEETFVTQMKRILSETNFEPKLLKIEITESVMMKDTNNIIVKLRELAELGIEISLDDFGTGYSSLNLLGKLPIHTLKIDQSFVQSMHQGEEQQSIISTIIAMASSLKKEIIAEGVEEEKQLRCLQNQGCTIFQGYYFNKPMSFEDIEPYLLSKVQIR